MPICASRRFEPRLEGGAALGRVDGLRLQLSQPQDVDQRAGAGETFGQGLGALAAHEIVGVGALGQEGEAERVAFAQDGQHAVDGARRRGLAGPVAVETDDRLGGEVPQKFHLALGEGGAERGHGVGEARLMERDHVHIAFDHDQLATLEGGLPGAGEVEHGRALVEQLGLGRVQIFGLGAVLERAGAEGDDAGLGVENGNGQPVAEAVIGRAPVIGLDDEPRFQQLRFG